MASALAWLEPHPLTPLTAAEAGDRHVAGIRFDGLVAHTPKDTLAAVDLLASPEGRAAALRGVLAPGAALARTTAVWVHTGRLLLHRTDLVVAPDRRVQATAVVHRQHLAAGDVVRVGGVPTTTPLRTAVDLLCFLEESTAVAGTRALLTRGLPAADVRAALHRPGRRLPVRRALRLLERSAAAPGRRLP